jgi:hypothetical protein
VNGNPVSFLTRMPNERQYVGSAWHHYQMVVVQTMIIGRSSDPEGLK